MKSRRVPDKCVTCLCCRPNMWPNYDLERFLEMCRDWQCVTAHSSSFPSNAKRFFFITDRFGTNLFLSMNITATCLSSKAKKKKKSTGRPSVHTSVNALSAWLYNTLLKAIWPTKKIPAIISVIIMNFGPLFNFKQFRVFIKPWMVTFRKRIKINRPIAPFVYMRLARG